MHPNVARSLHAPAARLARAVLIVFVAVAAAASHRPDREEIVAVLNAQNATTDLSLQRVRLLYGGYKHKWTDNLAVQLLLPERDSRAMRFLALRVFKIGDVEGVLRYYAEAVYQQRLSGPPPQLDAARTIERVRAMRGAIALVERSAVTDTRGVKIFSLGEIE